LAAVASTYAKTRQYNQALKVAQLITKAPYHKANAIAAVSRQYSQQAEPEPALRTAQMIENHKDTAEIKVKLLADIGSQYYQTGKPDKAAQVFAQAVQAVQIVDNTEEQSRLLSEVIVKYAQAGQPDAALQLIPKSRLLGILKPEL
jgi:tetratricopeptide (TPR) repeat protein